MDQIILLDGGTGQMIKESGFKCENENYLWSTAALICVPNEVKKIHQEFAEAGSKILYSNTYSLHFDEKENNGANINQLIKKNVEILELICSENNCAYRISIGPLAVKFHDCSEYTGIYIKDGTSTIKDVYDHYNSILCEIDKLHLKDIAFETIPTMAEIKGAISCLETYPRMNAFLTVVAKNENESAGGDCLIAIAKLVSKCPQILAFGINCCHPNICVSVAKLISPFLRDDQNIIVKPNDGRTWISETDSYAGKAYDLIVDFAELVANKVRYIGGCCSVKPNVIEGYRDFIKKHLEREAKN